MAKTTQTMTTKTRPLAPKGYIDLTLVSGTIEFRALLAWIGLWPVTYQHLPEEASIEFMKMAHVKHTLLAFWADEEKDGQRYTVGRAYRRIITKNWLGKAHQIVSLAKFGHLTHRPTVLVQQGTCVVLDGNHTLMGLCWLGYTGEVFGHMGNVDKPLIDWAALDVILRGMRARNEKGALFLTNWMADTKAALAGAQGMVVRLPDLCDSAFVCLVCWQQIDVRDVWQEPPPQNHQEPVYTHAAKDGHPVARIDRWHRAAPPPAVERVTLDGPGVTYHMPVDPDDVGGR